MLLDLFSKNKEYISCEELEYGLHFDIMGLYHCCSFFHSNKNYIPVTKLTGDLNKDFKNFLRQKDKDKKSHRKGHIIDRCENCFSLKKQKWQNSKLIKKIAISANKRCNCDCIYCTTHTNKQYYNSIQDIPVYDFIKKLFDKNLISQDCEVQIGGGESVLHFEFEKLISLFTDKLSSRIAVYTSGIKYSEGIERAIKLNRANIVISIDSGNKNLYKRIKNTDKFDEVTANLKKYCEAQQYSTENHQVAMKYVLIPFVNSHEEYLDEFLNLALNLNCKALRFDIENNWYKNNMHNLEAIKYIFKFMKYFDIKSEKMQFQHFFFQAPDYLIKNNKELYNDIQL